MVSVEKRKVICEKWNTDAKWLTEFVRKYIEQFKKDNNITDEEWEELRKDPESGEMS